VPEESQPGASLHDRFCELQARRPLHMHAHKLYSLGLHVAHGPNGQLGLQRAWETGIIRGVTDGDNCFSNHELMLLRRKRHASGLGQCPDARWRAT
jgi:hypothetical protein